MKKEKEQAKPPYKKPKAISLSGVAQGACSPGTTYTASQCKSGYSAGGNCWIGNIADSSCKQGQKAVYY